jgi:hypothetical protein
MLRSIMRWLVLAAACALLAVSGYLISRAAQQPAAAALTLAILAVRVAAIYEARTNYEAYLRILPEGPFALDAQKAIDRLSGSPDGLSGKKNSSQ